MSGQLIIGWAEAEGLLAPDLTRKNFREIIGQTYYADESNLRKASSAAGHMWRFVRQMEPDDLVVVPYGAEFFVAKVVDSATYDSTKVDDDSAYRRPVQWLNEGKPISRKLATPALVSRMKILGTSADATDLLPEIKECLGLAERG